ncbi:hypothetical protein ZIOFF_064745 [Zingiber officinale]|uniref:Late embryogenesis abundant protein LEA-2 subgroup domain-containing protein n=2 Tax=Zingiber officinale TaxID=94328 RepID=A0A8J5EWA6_ZINOF|nr:hypothetical protein ZIOFF_064745 [Zingiber officinale]
MCISLSRYWILAMAVFIALVFLAVVIIIPVLFLVPRMPEFAVSSACVTGFNLSSAQQQQLSASFDLNLTVHSPNRLKRIYYERVTASVVYASDILSENTLAPFDQGKGETTVLRVRLASLGEYVNSDVARGIESDRGRGDGAVGFNGKGIAWPNRLRHSIHLSLHSCVLSDFSMSSSAGNPKAAVVTGYPVSGSNGAPPRRPFYPPPADAPPSRYETFFERRRRRRLMALGVVICLVLIAVVLLAGIIFSLIPDPRTPEFAVSSACVTGFNLSAQQQQLSASFDLNLTVHNPSHEVRIYYEHVTASVLYASDILSENTLAPFYQGTGETTVLRVRLVALGEYVNSNVVRGIESDRGRGDGAVGFNVRVLSLYRFRSWFLSTSWSTLSVYCDDVLIGFGNGTNAATTGYLLGSAPKKCVCDSRRC